jgi:hypothetical protein
MDGSEEILGPVLIERILMKSTADDIIDGVSIIVNNEIFSDEGKVEIIRDLVNGYHNDEATYKKLTEETDG